MAEPARGILQNYVWEFTYRGETVTVHVADDGIVAPGFIALGGKPDRSAEEEARPDVLKGEMRDRILARPASEVYQLLNN